MKKSVILGAGMFGRNAEILVNRNNYEVIAFGDNNADVHNSALTPSVLPIAEALALSPDVVFIGVAGTERAEELSEQAREAGFGGKIVRVDELAAMIDVITAVTRKLAARIKELNIGGCVAELGVYKGDFAAVLSELFPGRILRLFDTFDGFDKRDLTGESVKTGEFSGTNVSLALAKLKYPENAAVHKGYFPETAAEVPENETFCFVSLDADLYAPTTAGLEWFYPRLEQLGVILVHDYGNLRFPGVKKAVDEFGIKNGGLALVPLCDLHGSAVITRI